MRAREKQREREGSAETNTYTIPLNLIKLQSFRETYAIHILVEYQVHACVCKEEGRRREGTGGQRALTCRVFRVYARLLATSCPLLCPYSVSMREIRANDDSDNLNDDRSSTNKLIEPISLLLKYRLLFYNRPLVACPTSACDSLSQSPIRGGPHRDYFIKRTTEPRADTFVSAFRNRNSR